MQLPENIQQHYDAGNETSRLSETSLERLRTASILRRFLPPPPAIVLDVGGADGIYAFPLAKQGYAVHLIDPVALHIEQAKAKNLMIGEPLQTLSVGDARKLSQADNSADAVLYLGPLYHLTNSNDRIQALVEAYRTLKPGGIFIAAFISKFTSLIDGVRSSYLSDPIFSEIVAQDLAGEPHKNPTGHPGYFTDAYFHHPHQARQEVEKAQFKNVQALSVEGPIWMISTLQGELADQNKRKQILSFLEQIESDETLIGASGHFIIVASK